MNPISLLEKARLADKLGNYRLADNLFNRVVRIAAGEAAFEEIIIKALEKAGMTEAGEITLEAMQRIFAESFDKAVAGEGAELNVLLREAGATEAEITEITNAIAEKDAAKVGTETVEKLTQSLLEKANSSEAILNRILGDTKPGFFDKIKEVGGNIKEWISQKMEKLGPEGVEKLKKAGIIASVVGVGAGGVILWRFTRNGQTVADEEVKNTLDENDPYKNMYQKRMDAKQQQRQGDAAQKFFEENKDKFKTQREFYDAALAAGDRNFANSVIALVKRDIPEMEVGSRQNNNF